MRRSSCPGLRWLSCSALLILSLLSLGGCAEGEVGTSIRVFLVYEEGWRMGAAEVIVEEKEASATISRELLVLLPDDMALGEPRTVEIWGVRDAERIAHGSAVAVPRKGETVDATVVLERLPCGVFCEPGDVQCEGEALSTCGADADGCMEWGEPVACEAPTPNCSAGQCRLGCVNDCVEGKCVDAVTQARCGEFDLDNCLDYSMAEPCAAGQLCYAGRCAPPCTLDPAFTNATLMDTANPYHPSVIIDTGGTPHAVYSVATTLALRYARRQGAVWTWSEINAAGKSPSLAVDSAGGLHVVFSAATGLRYGYKARTAPNWSFEEVRAGANIGLSSSLAVDRSGVPHLLYHNATTDELWYSQKTTGWVHELVRTSAGQGCDVTVDNAGTPHVSFYSSVNNVMYGKRTAANTWAVELATSPAPLAVPLLGGTSIARDRDGKTHIAYSDSYNDWFGTYYRLAVVSNIGGWADSIVDDTVDTGARPSLAVDPFDGLHVAYQTMSSTPALRYASRAPKTSTWSLSPQPAATRGYEPSIAIAPTGDLVILSAVRSGSLVETTRTCD